MKKTAACAFICSLVLLTGCGSNTAAVSSAKTDSTASSAAQTAVSAAKADDAVLSSVESIVDDGSFSLNTDSAQIVDASPEKEGYDAFIDLGTYKGLSIGASADTPIEMGMTIVMDYSGTIDGEGYDGNSDMDASLIVSQDCFIPGSGFENILVGKKAGDTFKETISVPDDYWDSLIAGKTIEYAVKINKVYYTTPEIALLSVIDSSVVKQYPKELCDSWREQLESTYISPAGFSSKDQSSSFGLDSSSIDSMICSNSKKDLVCRAIMDAEGISESSSAYQDAARALLDTLRFDSVDQMLEVGYSEVEVDSLISSRLAEDILESYQA